MIVNLQLINSIMRQRVLTIESNAFDAVFFFVISLFAMHLLALCILIGNKIKYKVGVN